MAKGAEGRPFPLVPVLVIAAVFGALLWWSSTRWLLLVVIAGAGAAVLILRWMNSRPVKVKEKENKRPLGLE